MTVLLVIPARYASTRYPGKPLVTLRGATGEPVSLIERAWRAAEAVNGVDRVVVATDDDRIRAASEAFGAEVVMTSDQCRNGTERCADVLQRLSLEVEMVCNLQGDAPLTPPWFLDDLIAGLRADQTAACATPVLSTSSAALNSFRQDRRAGRVGATTAVFGAGGRALYFSKEVLPFADAPGTPVFHHVGVYAYRPADLARYARLPEGPLERIEGLEQLRFLENGLPVRCVKVDAQGREFWELNNPEDVPRIEAILAAQGTP
ncbi:MAG: manno-octulosonate cytidylyltransferase [Pseudomonadota bacterium]